MFDTFYSASVRQLDHSQALIIASLPLNIATTTYE